jgi:hypothetical protein
MSHCTSISQVGDKLLVGPIDTSFISASTKLLPGTAVLNGPVLMGAALAAPAARATCTIGPPLSASLPASLVVDGVTNILGSFNVEGASLFAGAVVCEGLTIKQSADIKQGTNLSNALAIGNDLCIANLAEVVNGALRVDGVISCEWLDSQLAAAAASPPKGFDMHHPTKKGWRLTHICLEGPEAAVYHRGTLKGSNIIQLPDYWRGLVDSETITVHLTPIGTYQELSYEIFDWGTKIKILNNAGSAINCSYIVYGERKDVDKIVVEYEGKIEDYPGKDQRSIVGYHYDYRPGINA